MTVPAGSRPAAGWIPRSCVAGFNSPLVHVVGVLCGALVLDGLLKNWTWVRGLPSRCTEDCAAFPRFAHYVGSGKVISNTFGVGYACERGTSCQNRAKSTASVSRTYVANKGPQPGNERDWGPALRRLSPQTQLHTAVSRQVIPLSAPRSVLSQRIEH